MSRYEEALAHLQPGIRKGNARSIEVGMRVAERAAKLAGLDMPTKVAMTDEESNGIPLEALRELMNRADEEEEHQDHRSSEHVIINFTAQDSVPVAQLDEIVH
jgi:hypothetical protein